ncbi:MAG: hypothetical protein RL597_1086 [Pseudomonadota bacterium]
MRLRTADRLGIQAELEVTSNTNSVNAGIAVREGGQSKLRSEQSDRRANIGKQFDVVPCGDEHLECTVADRCLVSMTHRKTS